MTMPAGPGGGARPSAEGGWVADTPGLREIGLGEIDAESLAWAFKEFRPHLDHCRFPNCSHEHEPDCAVRAAVEKGELQEDRYSHYIKLKKESEFYEMSYLDKRKKDKAFGRFVKSVKKNMKR